MDIGTLTGQIEIEDQFTEGLHLIMNKVEEFAESFTERLGSIGIAAGVATAGIVAMTGAITALAVKGSDVNDVTATFEHFTESVGGADAVLGALQEGTRKTVDNMVLMRDASRLLSANVKLNVDDFKTLGDAAYVMQNRGLGSTKEMLDLVSNAMVTGRTRTLALKLGVVDAGDAEQNYATKLGLTKDQLNATQLADAKRIAIMDLLRKSVSDAGAQEVSFAGKIDQVRTAISNWIDEFSGLVASSPNVTHAIDAVLTALTGLTEGNSVMEKLMAAINEFADAVTAAVPYVQAFASGVSTTIGVLVDFGTAIYNVISPFKELIAAFVLWQTGGALISGVVAGFSLVEKQIVAMNVALAATPARAAAAAASVEALGAASSIGALAVTALTSPLVLGAVAVGTFVASVTAAYQAVQFLGEHLERAAQGIRQAQTDGHNLAVLNRELGTSFKTIDEAVAEYRKRLADTKPVVEQLTAAQEKWNALAKMHDDTLQRLSNQLASAAFRIDATSEAFDKLTDEQKANVDVQRIMIPLLDDHLERNIALSDSEKAFYESVTMARINQEAESGEKLKAKEISLDYIKTLEAMGMTQKEIAAILDTSVGAVKRYEDGLSSLEKATRTYNDLRSNENKTATDIAIDQHRREYEDAARNLDSTSAYYSETMDKLDGIRRQRDAAENSSWNSLKLQSREAMQDLADGYKRDLDRMTQSGLTFSQEVIEEQRKKWREAQDAVSSYGGAAVKASSDATKGVQETIDKVRTLSGELLTLEEYQKRQQSGGAHEVTSQNFQQELQAQTNPWWNPTGAGSNVDFNEATRLAHAGYSFQEIMSIFETRKHSAPNTPIPPPKGPRIPGFADGGVVRVGESGPETVRLPFGSQVMPASMTQSQAVTLNFHVNGTAEEAWRRIRTIAIDELRLRTKFGAA
jgi:DNA-binding transcriptional regulator YiaG